jgi:hypothetical protein
MIKVMQYFEFLRLVNVKALPQNYNAFLEIFSSNIFDIMPNPLSIKETPQIPSISTSDSRILAFDEQVSESNRYCDLHSKFSGLDFECLFLNNAGNLGLQLLFLMIFKGLIRALVSRINKSNTLHSNPSTSKHSQKQGFFDRNVTKVDKWISFAFLIEFVQAMHLDLIMAAYINMRNLWLTPFVVWINSTISMIVWFFYLYLIVLILNKSRKIEMLKQRKESFTPKDIARIELKYDLKKWEFLKEHLKEDRTFFQGILNDLVFAKDFLVAGFIILFLEWPAM